MDDFANLQCKARIDLGINIKMNFSDLRLDDNGLTKKYFVVGKIVYPDNQIGTLVYIKASVTGNEREHILAYRRKNPDFPHETTANQFFNEDQFEAYRKLGELIGEALFPEEAEKGKIDSLKKLEDFLNGLCCPSC